MITKLDSITFDNILQEQDPFGTKTGKFDLHDVQLITPAALTELAAAVHALARGGLHPEIIIEEESVRSYLLRAGFFQIVGAVAQIEPPLVPGSWYDRLRGSNPMLIEVTRMETGASLPELLDKIVWVLRHRLKYRKYDAFDVVTAVSEICQNTFDHNHKACGFLAMQVYGKGSRRFLEIGVADYGAGIAATLRRNPKNQTINSDIEAIREAAKLGTSEHDDPTRGTGLYHLLEITYKHCGSIQIRSGAGKVRYRMDKKVGWTFSVPPMPGVQVALTLPAKSSS
jgi:anti-sigma regulatory factor (Ser/Thr protein kinase)